MANDPTVAIDRENFSSRVGFLLVSAGCAVGIGNVWRFPFVTGQNGGGVFVLFYIIFLIILAIPAFTMELAVGRASHRSALPAFRMLEKPGTKFHLHGYVCYAGSYLLMMYYTVVSGWMLAYFVKFLKGDFTANMNQVQVQGVYNAMTGSPGQMVMWTGITVVLGFLIVSFGLQKGVESTSKYLMSALFILITVLAIHSCFLKGAGAGVSFYLKPDFHRAAKQGIWNVITAAMNQSFFTLSIGISSMEIFGSYMSDEKSIPGEAVRVAGLDTFVALMAGLIIFPACFSFGVQPDAGPSLIFVTLPNVFIHMHGGRVWGTLFFVFMTFASFSTVIAVFENIIATTMEIFHISRVKSSIICGILMFILSMPCALGYNVWSSAFAKSPMGNVLGAEDFLLSNILLPLGCLVFVSFCNWKIGWGQDNYFAEINKGDGMKIPRWMGWYFKYGLPVLIAIIFVSGMISYFQ